jgi:hypothetical protein
MQDQPLSQHQQEEDRRAANILQGIMYRQSAGGVFVPGKLQNRRKTELKSLVGASMDAQLLAKGVGQPRNAPCACGSGKKFKKCCMIKTTKKMMMHKKTEDWEIVSSAVVTQDTVSGARKVHGLETLGRVFVEVPVGETFNLFDLDPAMSGPARITEQHLDADPPYCDFKTTGNCCWPPSWNEEWAQNVQVVRATSHGEHPKN